MNVRQNASGQRVEVRLADGSQVPCASQGDAELVRAAERAFFSGDGKKKVPQGTLDALRRAGMHEGNSPLYRSAMHRGEEE